MRLRIAHILLPNPSGWHAQLLMVLVLVVLVLMALVLVR